MSAPQVGQDLNDPNSANTGTAAPNIKFDLENGDASNEKSHSMAIPNEGELDEYSGLVRYISTYRDGRRKSIASSVGAAEGSDEPTKQPWWAFWRQAKGDARFEFIAPEEWLTTELKRGLSNQDVETRRKKTGFNELTTEKENMFIKFLMYFTGPILYGTFFPRAILVLQRPSVLVFRLS